MASNSSETLVQARDASAIGKTQKFTKEFISKTKASLSIDDEAGKSPRCLHLKDLSTKPKCYVFCNTFENNTQNSSLKSLKKDYEIDLKNIGATFSFLNFDVKVRKDLTKAEMEEKLNVICQKDYSDDKCLAIFILSHGSENGEVYGADESPLKVDTIVERIQGVNTLVDKPKFLFIQACRGPNMEKAVNVVRPAGEFRKARVARKANTLVYYSSMQGDISWTGDKTGSFFVAVLTKVLWKYNDGNASDHPGQQNEGYWKLPRYHFGDVITRVNDIVSSYVREKVIVQASEVRSSLTENIYFYPSKQNYEEYMKKNYSNDEQAE